MQFRSYRPSLVIRCGMAVMVWDQIWKEVERMTCVLEIKRAQSLILSNILGSDSQSTATCDYKGLLDGTILSHTFRRQLAVRLHVRPFIRARLLYYGLIYTPRFVVKKWRKLLECQSRNKDRTV